MITAAIITAACGGVAGIIAAIAQARRLRRAQEAKLKNATDEK